MRRIRQVQNINGVLVSDKDSILERWAEHYNAHF